jgi:putative transposase
LSSPVGATRRGGTLSHSFSKNHQHIIFGTAGRRPAIAKQLQPKLWAYMAGICRNHKMFVRAIGGIEDHVHLLVELPATLSVAQAVSLIKSNSSKWVNKEFAWQIGYGAFSVSASNLAAVTRYINSQAEHHRKMTFADEFAQLLKKHGVKLAPEDMLE